MEGVVFQLTDSTGAPVSFVLQENGSYAATVIASNGDWVLAAQSGLAITDELTTNSNGAIELTGIPFGEYTLTEIKTAEGHALLVDPISVTLPYAVEGTEDTSPDEVYYIEGENGSGANYYLHLNYDISNAVTIRLPATGEAPISLWLSAFGIMMAGAAAILPVSMRNKRRNKQIN